MKVSASKLTAPIRNDRKPLWDLIPLSQPLRVLIDPSDVCNLSCNFCFQSTDRSFKGKIMTDSIFEIVLKQLKEFEAPINVVHLYGLGEPLINKNIANYVKRLKTEKVAREVAITTNGTLLTKKISDELSKSSLDRLSISLNGLNNEDFYRITGRNIEFGELYENIKYFYSIKSNCHLHIKINGECFKEEDHNKFVDLFSNYADSINIDHVVEIWPGIKAAEEMKQREAENMYNLNMENTYEKMICPQMFYEMVIHSDGSVSPCCVDYGYKKQNLGNIFDCTLKKIWSEGILKDMQYSNINGKKIPYDVCMNCNYPKCGSTVNITPYREELKKSWVYN